VRWQQAIGPDDAECVFVPDDQVVAPGIECVDVEAVAALEGRPEFFSEDLEAESLGVLDGGGIGGQHHGEATVSP